MEYPVKFDIGFFGGGNSWEGFSFYVGSEFLSVIIGSKMVVNE